MAIPQRSDQTWLRAALALLATQLAFILLVHMRPGLLALLLWYIVPPILLIAAVSLLLVAFVRSARSRQVPSGRQLGGYAALLASVLSLSALRVYPSSYDGTPSRVPFRVPLDGPVTVAWGGPTPSTNYHAVMPDQRWAYDLLVTRNGVSFRGAGARPEDYYAYGREVVAPAGGVVRRVRDGEPDGPIGQRRLFGAFGNHVVMEVAKGEFLFVAHLRSGSIAVRPGDAVSAGDSIGRIGNSGNSSEPHVHLHLQARPTPSLGEAIPFYFYGYRLAGMTVTRGMPLGGRTIRTRVRTGVFTGDVIEHLVPGPSMGGTRPRSRVVYWRRSYKVVRTCGPPISALARGSGSASPVDWLPSNWPPPRSRRSPSRMERRSRRPDSSHNRSQPSRRSTTQPKSCGSGSFPWPADW